MFFQKVGFISLLAVMASLSLSKAQVQYSGCCPTDIQVVSNFNVPQYMGVWYEQQKYPNVFQPEGKCVTAQYTLNPVDSSVDVLNSQVNLSNGRVSSVNGKATLAENGKLIVNFPTGINNSVRSNYWVLDTDYNTYAVVYSCAQTSADSYGVFAWILTRDRTPAAATITKARAVLSDQNISLTPLTNTDQTCCSA